MLDAIAKLPLKDPDLFRQANYIGGAVGAGRQRQDHRRCATPPPAR